MSDLTKAEKRLVRDLLDDAFEAELATALADVESAIAEWRRGELRPSEVQERIHEFHKESQEIFKTYNNLEPLLVLARAVEFEFIAMARVPESLRERLEPLRALVR
jgi:hypothetical protein